MTRPTQSAVAEALAVVTNPAAHRPGMRVLAWRVLKAARGQTVRLGTLPNLPRVVTP